jgi:hypothetical protein
MPSVCGLDLCPECPLCWALEHLLTLSYLGRLGFSFTLKPDIEACQPALAADRLPTVDADT